MKNKTCPYIYEECKRKDTSCLTGYEACHEYHEKERGFQPQDIGIGAMVDFKHIVNGRFYR